MAISSRLVYQALCGTASVHVHAVVQVEERRRQERHEQAADDGVGDDHWHRLTRERERQRHQRDEDAARGGTACWSP